MLVTTHRVSNLARDVTTVMLYSASEWFLSASIHTSSKCWQLCQNQLQCSSSVRKFEQKSPNLAEQQPDWRTIATQQNRKQCFIIIFIIFLQVILILAIFGAWLRWMILTSSISPEKCTNNSNLCMWSSTHTSDTNWWRCMGTIWMRIVQYQHIFLVMSFNTSITPAVRYLKQKTTILRPILRQTIN
jgi:hypothetical protein